jgi:hypothetical protein
VDLIKRLYWLADAPFGDVPLPIIFCIAAVYFFAFLARGAVGFGAVAPAVIVTSLLIPPHHAVLLALLAASLPQLKIIPEGIRYSDWHIARPVILGIGIGIPVGVGIFVNLKSDWLLLILGSVVATLVLLDMMKILDRLFKRLNLRSTGIPFGLSVVTALQDGLIGSGGVVTLAIYLKHACRDHKRLRATLILVGTVMLYWRLLVTVAAGLVTTKLLVEAVFLIPAVYGGISIGNHYFRTVTPGRYHLLLQIIILMSAVALVIDGGHRLTQ